jgi:hypothetical protein
MTSLSLTPTLTGCRGSNAHPTACFTVVSVREVNSRRRPAIVITGTPSRFERPMRLSTLLGVGDYWYRGADCATAVWGSLVRHGHCGQGLTNCLILFPLLPPCRLAGGRYHVNSMLDDALSREEWFERVVVTEALRLEFSPSSN